MNGVCYKIRKFTKRNATKPHIIIIISKEYYLSPTLDQGSQTQTEPRGRTVKTRNRIEIWFFKHREPDMLVNSMNPLNRVWTAWFMQNRWHEPCGLTAVQACL